jgi:hypothetical protein
MAMTVTATQGTTPSNGMQLSIKVLTNAAVAGSQSGASFISSTAINGSIVTTVAGSIVYIAVTNENVVAAEPLCTIINSFHDTTNLEYYTSLRTTSATGTPGSTLVGCTGTASFPGIAAQEILAAGTITEDGSAPIPATTMTATAVTSASFTPPAGSLIVAMIACNGAGSGSAETCTVTDTGGGLTWIQKAHTTAAASLYAGVWIASVPGGGATGILPQQARKRMPAYFTRINTPTRSGGVYAR